MRFPRKRGSTSVMVRVWIPDNSSTTGAGLTGLTNSSTNLTIEYMRELDSAVTSYSGANIEAQTTVGTYQAPSSSSKIRFKETAISGLYELQFHDSATAFGTADASGAVYINIREATTTALKIGPNAVLIPLVPWDQQDGVRMGLTALPNAAAEAAGGLITSGTGTGQLSVSSGKVSTPDTQKVDVNTIKTQSVTASAGVTFPASIGTSTLTQTQVSGGAYDLTNATYIAALKSGLGTMPGDVVSISGDATAADNAESFFDGTGYAGTGNTIPTVTTLTNLPSIPNNWLTAAGISAAALSGKGDWLTAAGTLARVTLVDTVTTLTGYSAPPSAATISGQVATDLATAHGAGSWATATGFSTLDAAGVRTAVGLGSANLDTQLSTIAGYVDIEVGAVYTLLGQMAGATFDTSTDSLEAIRNRGDAAWVTGGAGSAPTAGEVADAVWDELLAGHGVAGSAGAGLAAAGSAGDPWASLLPGSYAAGTAGYMIGAQMFAKVNLITSTSVVTTGPVAQNGFITLYRNTTRSAATGNAITLTVPLATLDLTGWTLKFGMTKLTSNAGTASLEVTGTVSGAGTANQTVTFALTMAQTAALAMGTTDPLRAYSWTIAAYQDATPDNGVVLASGFVTVKGNDTSYTS